MEALRLTDRFLAEHGFFPGKPTLTARWRPEDYRDCFSAGELGAPHVKARSFTFRDFPHLDGQWQGILTDGDTWFSISSHSGCHHAQIVRYSVALDRIDHVADLGQVVGEKLPEHADGVPDGKIHSEMFEVGDRLYCTTTDADAHRLHEEVYTGGYWLAIDKASGRIENLGRTLTGDGLLCVGYDYDQFYGHTNVEGLLTRFDPATGEETVLGFPWEGSGRDWPRGLSLMFTGDGRIYGGRPPRCSFWESDPASGDFRTLPP